MEITSIRVSSRKGWIELIFNDNTKLLVTTSIIADHKLYKGKDISEKEFEKIKDESHEKYFYSRVLYFLGIRPRSRKEVHDYLYKKGCRSGIIKKIIGMLEKEDYIDDAKFCEWWVRQRLSGKFRGRKLIFFELKAKGIDISIIETALSESLSEKDEIKMALKLINRKFGSSLHFQEKSKAMSYLLRKGFNYDIVKIVMNKKFHKKYEF